MYAMFNFNIRSVEMVTTMSVTFHFRCGCSAVCWPWGYGEEPMRTERIGTVEARSFDADCVSAVVDVERVHERDYA